MLVCGVAQVRTSTCTPYVKKAMPWDEDETFGEAAGTSAVLAWSVFDGFGEQTAGAVTGPTWYFPLQCKQRIIKGMVQVVTAIFKDGVFKPDQRPALSDSVRVRLVVETINGNEADRGDESWATLQRLWDTSRFNSGGDRLTRDQLHERH